jgi:hypothetical protein
MVSLAAFTPFPPTPRHERRGPVECSERQLRRLPRARRNVCRRPNRRACICKPKAQTATVRGECAGVILDGVGVQGLRFIPQHGSEGMQRLGEIVSARGSCECGVMEINSGTRAAVRRFHNAHFSDVYRSCAA